MDVNEPHVLKIPFTLLQVNDAFNCREQITPVSVMTLAEQIAKDGLLQYPVVRSLTEEEQAATPNFKYDLVAGFRRVKACKMLEWTEIPVLLKEVTIEQAKIINLVENLGRENLTFWEECLAIEDLTKAGYSRDDVAEELKQSPGWVQRRQNVWKSPKRVQDMVRDGILGPSHVQQLYKYRDENELNEVLDSIREKHKKNMHNDPEADNRLKSIHVPKPSKAKKDAFKLIKKARGRHEIFNLSLFLRREWQLPDGPWYRLLAWAGGEITDEELLTDLKQFLLEIYEQEVEMPDGIPEMEV